MFLLQANKTLVMVQMFVFLLYIVDVLCLLCYFAAPQANETVRRF